MRNKVKSPKKRIHRKLKKSSPHGVKKAKKLFGFKYPKLFLLILCIFLAYYIFSRPIVSDWMSQLNTLSYFGIFIGGLLIAFGFSAPFGVGILITSQPESILLATLLAGAGAMISDMLIFKTIKFSFMNEFEELKKTKTIKKIKKIIHHNKHILIQHYLLYVFAGIMIATPLPDEIGVSMLAGLTTVKPSRLAVISFILHTIAISLILYFSISI